MSTVSPYVPEKTSSRGSETDHKNQKNGVALTLDERRRAALQEVDDAPFSWFHAKVALVASVGFFTDAYDIFAVSCSYAPVVPTNLHPQSRSTSHQS